MYLFLFRLYCTKTYMKIKRKKWAVSQRSPHLGFLEHDSRPQQAPYSSLVAHHISTYRSSTSGQKNARSAQGSSYNSWKQLSKWNLLNTSGEWRERCLRRHVCALRAAVRSRIPLTCDRCTRLALCEARKWRCHVLCYILG